MTGWLEKFLVSLAFQILEAVAIKTFEEGSAAYKKYKDFKLAMIAAGKYQEVVDKPGGASREERRKSEDDLLS